jgi:molybdate transport system substrate-binding protein
MAVFCACASPAFAARIRTPQEVVVYATTSLADVVGELADRYTRMTGVPVHVAFASSAAISEQLDHGARADVVIMPSDAWLDALAARHRIETTSRFDLASDRLVLIAPIASPARLAIGARAPLLATLGESRLAVSNPQTVPAGQSARAALMALGLWSDVVSHLVYGGSDRATLALVARGEAALGVVYATDARNDPRVRVVDTLPAGSHPPIHYALALGRGAGLPAAAFAGFLRGADAAATFGKYGFGNPGAAGFGTDGAP